MAQNGFVIRARWGRRICLGSGPDAANPEHTEPLNGPRRYGATDLTELNSCERPVREELQITAVCVKRVFV